MTLPIVVYTSETAWLIMALKRNETAQISFPEKIPGANLIMDPGKNELDSFPATHCEFEMTQTNFKTSLSIALLIHGDIGPLYPLSNIHSTSQHYS